MESAVRYDSRHGGVRPWLFGIAHNQLGLIIRSEYRDRGLRARLGAYNDRHADDMARIDEQIDASRAIPRVERALATLPEPQREALWLVGYDGLTPSEAAQAIGVGPGAFRVQLLRARRALRAALEDVSRPVVGSYVQDSNPTEMRS
jgi:RNA polymerase sigma-70 factor (ECF subfamily)